MKIIIGGDLVPTKKNIEYFKNNNLDKLMDKNIKKKWFAADFRIFNLETPLVDEQNPILKNGPNLIASTDSIKGIKNLNPSLISLANNHIMDHGIKGYNSTIKLLANNSIPQVGSGYNLEKASKAFIFEKENKKIGIYSCAEHEFTIAEEDKAGANPFDPLESLDHIQNLKNKCDYVIVLYHGGKEHYRYPSPNLQKRCRKMTEKGADLVLCQHSHCIGSYEKYKDSTILYGQGNFIFNSVDNEFWNSGLLVEVSVGDKLEVEYIPFETTDCGIKLVKNKNEFLEEFYNRSEEIKSSSFVETKYDEFAEEKIKSYLHSLSGLGKWFSRIDRYIFKGLITKKLYNETKLLKILNFVKCEAHRELLIEILKEEIY